MRLKSIITLSLLIFIGSICRASTETEYLAIFIDGKKAGYTIHTREQKENEVRTTDKLVLTITRFDIPMTVTTVETSIETPEGEPVGFDSVQDMSIIQMHIQGKVNPDKTVDVTITTGASEQKKTITWPEGAVMAEGLLLSQRKNGFKEGAEYKIKVFSPSLLGDLDTTITVGSKKRVDLLGKEANLTEVISKTNIPMAGEIVSVTYVDKDFKTLKSLTPMMGMQLEMVSCSAEYAMGENADVELYSKAFVKSPEPINNIHSVRSVKYYIEPTQKDVDLTIPSSDNQTVKKQASGRMIVLVRPARSLPASKIGYEGTEQEVLEALKPTRFVQSDDPDIKEAAKKIVGNTKDAYKAAKEIEKFVAEHVENKNLSVGYATAAEVFQSREGDCSEFAVLTAALCRAAGIPARVVVGIAYVDEFMDLKEVFGGHAWNEVYIGNKWVGLDSAFRASGRGGFDAGHIALASGSGNLEDYFGLLFNLGKFKIEKLEVRK